MQTIPTPRFAYPSREGINGKEIPSCGGVADLPCEAHRAKQRGRGG
jgi:hypothetical protein